MHPLELLVVENPLEAPGKTQKTPNTKYMTHSVPLALFGDSGIQLNMLEVLCPKIFRKELEMEAAAVVGRVSLAVIYGIVLGPRHLLVLVVLKKKGALACPEDPSTWGQTFLHSSHSSGSPASSEVDRCVTRSLRLQGAGAASRSAAELSRAPRPARDPRGMRAKHVRVRRCSAVFGGGVRPLGWVIGWGEVGSVVAEP